VAPPAALGPRGFPVAVKALLVIGTLEVDHVIPVTPHMAVGTSHVLAGMMAVHAFGSVYLGVKPVCKDYGRFSMAGLRQHDNVFDREEGAGE